MSKTTTINICPRWIDIIDVLLYSWKENHIDDEARDGLRKEFHKLARIADDKMKELKQGPYSKGGLFYEETKKTKKEVKI